MSFEALLNQQTGKRSRARRIMLIASIGAHAVALSAGVVHSLWRVDELPMPAVHVTLATSAPPPPPPPPPAATKSAGSKPKRRPIEPKPNVIAEPKQTKAEPEPEPADSQSDAPEQPGAQAQGVVGGVSGGVVGGVLGSQTPPPPTPKDTGPKLVSAQVARGQLLIDPNAEPYRVKLPPMLARSGASYYAVVRMCVSAQGAVTGVQLVRPASPAIDPQIPSVLGRWRYRPLLLDGKPTAFCYMLRYEIAAR